MVCVTVCPPDRRPSDEDRRAVLRMFQERIHGYQVDYKKRHPTEYRKRRPRLGRFRRL